MHSKTLKTTSFTVLFLVPAFVFANTYYVEDYDPDYTPYNLEEAIEHIDFPTCKTAVEGFDSYYNQLASTLAPITIGEQEDIDFAVLRELYENEFRNCLTQYRKEEKDDAVKDCDFSVIDDLSVSERNTYSGEILACEIERALDNCDLDYIDTMSGGQKVIHHKVIAECREDDQLEEEKVNVQEVTETTHSVPAQTQQDLPPVAPSQNFLPTTPSVPPETVTTQPAPVGGSDAVSDADSRSASSSATTTDKIEMSAEEFDRVVTERVNQALEEQTRDQSEQERPSFFRRAIDFLFGWMW